MLMIRSLLAIFLVLTPYATNATEFTVSADAESGYVVGSGVRVVDQPFTKYFARAGFENGMYVELWAGIDGLQRFVEVDYTVGKTWRPAKHWTLDLSLNWYDLAGIGFADTRGDVLSPILEIRRELGEHSYAFAGVEPMFAMSQRENDGALAYVGAGTSVQLGRINFTVEGRAGYDSTFQLDRWYGKFSLQPTIKLGKDTTVRFAGLTAWVPEDAEPELVVNFIGVSHNF